ncbi:MAG: hypothetical protein HKN76_06065, partial [Saprospiraceae bacterium]|nr:hypothetical protein [Saprospiraceae bacterium]
RQELLQKNGQSEAYFYNASSTSNAGYDQLKKQDLLEIAQSVGKKSYHAFKLYHYGYTYKEIAAILDIAIGTVKSRINFLRSKVKGAHENLSFCDN